MLIHSDGARWSLWAKVGAVGNAHALSTASPPVRHQPHRPQIHGAVLAGSVVCECMHSPFPLRAFKLVFEHLRVHAFAFVAKPEQLLERNFA